ncbi:MAG: 2-amino-4-hydroxy-6-hydroxymethyldihydropteridine diphosphokinase, partial [Gammaproteobacteria bacterium]|uniref:2-amino-4-hydroxy-6- hydroxymethyldihydropteridine diphosphokinase n=1 Tax=Luteimonas sp. JM171 TaxID=1896164 RepID=UPI0008583A69|nr:2-amino-4-hydroxy-6-hydroxymethyldihydropteridine diphosphokinase [Luteimonas sp. JM171]AOH36672.1 2-amino-4-hydroxy-6-hydroxymethyldihydropteridine diphosphokinase [Luteimonas sp. JM171]NLC61520.1 2-amino-4-hydroxy-6-hydroxymethyldihydropteridine diphosphokinase [Gammaproteobacteria bacterium]
MNSPAIAAVGLGGNVGDSARVLGQAFEALAGLPQTRLLATSALYRTPAWGLEDQADFVNAVAALETALEPAALLGHLFAIERRFGRVRAADGSDRWGPRTLDLDILLHGEAVIDEPGLRIPHPRLHERAFALVPLLDVLPEAVIPGVGPAREALAAVDAGGVRRLHRPRP